MRMRQAIAAALADEMAADDSVVVLGEDIGAAGGVFKASEGLLDRFGPDRVRDTPIAEMGFLGAAVGAAMCGVRPVAEIMFAEFLGVALDPVVTEAAKFRYLTRGEFTVPMVVRVSCGAGQGFGAQHSQTLETWFTNTPGLKVVTASGAASAYGLLRAAVRDPDPVVFFEPRVLYGEREEVDREAELPRLDAARTLRTGSAMTVVALGQTVPTALAAVESSGVDAEVIDLVSVAPWDVDAVTASVACTGTLVVVEADSYSGGWGSLIVAEVVSKGFAALRTPPLRITAPDAPVPYTAPLEARYLPSVEYVREQLTTVAAGHTPRPWWETVEHA